MRLSRLRRTTCRQKCPLPNGRGAANLRTTRLADVRHTSASRASLGPAERLEAFCISAVGPLPVRLFSAADAAAAAVAACKWSKVVAAAAPPLPQSPGAKTDPTMGRLHPLRAYWLLRLARSLSSCPRSHLARRMHGRRSNCKTHQPDRLLRGAHYALALFAPTRFALLKAANAHLISLIDTHLTWRAIATQTDATLRAPPPPPVTSVCCPQRHASSRRPPERRRPSPAD